MSFKPIDSRRDEFRKYLERNGVVDELTKVLIKLFNTPERPENAVEFIFENLGHTLLHKDQHEYLKKELEDSRNEIAILKREIEKLQAENTKIQNDADIEIKQEPIDVIESSHQNENGKSIDEKQIISDTSLQGVQEEEITSSKVGTQLESDVDNKDNVIENNKSTVETQESNVNKNEKLISSIIEEPTSTTDELKGSNVLENEKGNDCDKIIVTVPKSNEEVISTSNANSVSSESSTKENVQKVTSIKSDESTNNDKPAEDNKENKKADIEKN